MSSEPVVSDVALQENNIKLHDDAARVPNQHSETPPTTPPAAKPMASTESNSMPPPSTNPEKRGGGRKRSSDEMSGEEKAAEKSKPAVDNSAQPVSKDQLGDDTANPDAPSSMVPDSQTQGRQWPAIPPPASNTSTQPQQTPPSAQPSESQAKAKSKSKKPDQKATKAASKASKQDVEEERSGDASSSSDLSELGEPQERIGDFDWRGLEERYHAKCTELSQKENALFAEYNQLIESFGIWADAGSRKEGERGFKRLKTRVTYVQNEEDELEDKRQHYIRVVEAFRTICVMLNAPPNWAEERILPNSTSLKRRVSGTSHTNGRPSKRRRSNRYRYDVYGAHRVGDVHMESYRNDDLHASRCVVQ